MSFRVASPASPPGRFAGLPGKRFWHKEIRPNPVTWYLTLVALFLALFLCSSSAEGAQQPPPVMLALILGNGVYHGEGTLQPLEHADNDVVRFARALQPFVPPDRMLLLMDPDEEAARVAISMGFSHWQAPTRGNLLDAFDELKAQRDAIEEASPGIRVHVVVFVSAHGDSQGVHLQDGIFTGGALQASLEMLDADQITVVADSCFSDYWLGLKGAAGDGNSARIQFPADAVAAAVRDLEQVGAITAQSYTREERTLIRGGLLTHVVSSALVGAADVNHDGSILYDELRAYLEVYARQTELIDRIMVHSPKRAAERPPVLVDLNQLAPRGLRFPARSETGDECFWIRTPQGDIVAELCKKGLETRQIWLPPGRYQIQRRCPPDRKWGDEGWVEVADHFVDVRADSLSGYWVSSLLKGTDAHDDPPPSAARALSNEEATYLMTTPFRSSVGWKDLPGRLQGSIRATSGLPLVALTGNPAVKPLEVSLTQEEPSGGVAGVMDWRAAPLGRGYFSLGFGLGLGASPENSIGTIDHVWVYDVQYQARAGYERPSARWTGRIALSAGGMSAGPIFFAGDEATGETEGNAPSQESSAQTDLKAYRLFFFPRVGLELSCSIDVGQETFLDLGGGPALVVEPHLVESGQGLTTVSYLNLGVFAGIRW